MKVIRVLLPLTLLSIVVLTACGAPSQGTVGEPTAAAATTAAEGTADQTAAAEAAPATTGEKTTIAYWYDPPDVSGTPNCFVDTVVNAFNAQSTTVAVEAVEQPQSWDATRTALQGGAGPDVVVTPGPSFAFELAQADQLLALDEYVTQYGWSERFVPWALNLGKVDGKLYSVPNEQETLVLYYNKTLFEQKGWTAPKTMDEMMALAKTIKDDGIIPFAASNAEWRPTNEHYVGEFMNHVAGPQKVWEALTGKAEWTDPDLVRSIELLNEAQQNGYFMGGLDRYYTATSNEVNAAFGNGEAAMFMTGTWFLNEINQFFGEAANNANEWDWVPTPSQSGDAIFDLGIGSTYSINKATENPKAVADFLDFVFSPATQGQLLSKCSMAPAPVRLEANALQDLDPRVASLYETLATASEANNYGYTTWTFWPPKSDVFIYEEIEKVWANQQSPQEYLEGLQSLFDDEVAQGDIPPIPPR